MVNLSTSVSYRTINRFRAVSSTHGLIKQMYLAFYTQLKEQDLISDDVILLMALKSLPMLISIHLSGAKLPKKMKLS